MPLKMILTRENVHEQSGMLRIWLQAFRLHFVPTSIFPAVLGSVIAWVSVGEFNYWNFVIVISGVTLHHIALNMTDDVFDYIHAVDRSYGHEKNPYSGGSGVLTGKLLSAGQMLAAAVFCYSWQ